MAAADTESSQCKDMMSDDISDTDSSFTRKMECEKRETGEENCIQSKESKVEEVLLADDLVPDERETNGDVICSLAEDEHQQMRENENEIAMNKKEKDPLSLSMIEDVKGVPIRNEDDDDDDSNGTDDSMSSEEYSSEDDFDDKEEKKRMPMPRMQLLKTIGHNGEVTYTEIPAHIQITRVPESKEDRLKREQELARRKEAAKNCEGYVPSPIKRKHSERMTLEDVKRDDFEEAQDYVDFIQSKLKNISIKQCK